jgi:hypothetical protein
MVHWDHCSAAGIGEPALAEALALLWTSGLLAGGALTKLPERYSQAARLLGQTEFDGKWFHGRYNARSRFHLASPVERCSIRRGVDPE